MTRLIPKSEVSKEIGLNESKIEYCFVTIFPDDRLQCGVRLGTKLYVSNYFGYHKNPFAFFERMTAKKFVKLMRKHCPEFAKDFPKKANGVETTQSIYDSVEKCGFDSLFFNPVTITWSYGFECDTFSVHDAKTLDCIFAYTYHTRRSFTSLKEFEHQFDVYFAQLGNVMNIPQEELSKFKKHIVSQIPDKFKDETQNQDVCVPSSNHDFYCDTNYNGNMISFGFRKDSKLIMLYESTNFFDFEHFSWSFDMHFENMNLLIQIPKSDIEKLKKELISLIPDDFK